MADEHDKVTLARFVRNTVFLVVGVGLLITLAAKSFTTVNADENVVCQSFWTGKLTVWFAPGPHFQFCDSIVRYKKSEQYSFSAAKDQGKTKDESIRARFNDGGFGNISGTLRFELPNDERLMLELHTKFHSQTAIDQQLIRPSVERAVYMSGPLMSSKESASERRSDLLQYIEDQVLHGVYRTRSREDKVADPVSGKERTVTRVELVDDPAAPNHHARQEPSPLTQFGVRAYSFNVNGLAYDQDVEEQIKSQQKLQMQVQTAMASAKEAEQRAITVEKEGQANAANAKWKQEAIKAGEVTKAEQEKAVAITVAEKERDVAKLGLEAAEFTKQQQIKLGEGEAKRARLVMEANGALEMKLEAYKHVMGVFATEFGKQKWVPEIMIGGDGHTGGGANALMQMLMVKTAKDLSLDVKMDGKK